MYVCNYAFWQLTDFVMYYNRRSRPLPSSFCRGTALPVSLGPILPRQGDPDDVGDAGPRRGDADIVRVARRWNDVAYRCLRRVI